MKKNDEKTIDNYIKRIDKTIESELKSIPDEVLHTILDRSFDDAKTLFENGKNTDLKHLSYSLYRSYILGMLLERMNRENKMTKYEIEKKIDSSKKIIRLAK